MFRICWSNERMLKMPELSLLLKTDHEQMVQHHHRIDVTSSFKSGSHLNQEWECAALIDETG